MKHIHVSDVERDRACVIPRQHFAVGRLKKDELDTRIAVADGMHELVVRWFLCIKLDNRGR